MITTPWEKGYLEGMEAVRCKPIVAPRNPYREEHEAEQHEGWEAGAIEAGIGELYTNGILNKEAA